MTKKLLDTVLNLTLQKTRILLIGSAAEYGSPKKLPISELEPTRPLSMYGLSKAMQTQSSAQYYADVHGLFVLIARTFNMTGEGISAALAAGAFSRQIASAKDGDTITVGNLETERDFLAVDEVVARYVFLLEHGETGSVYNICSGKPTKMSVLLDEMIRASGKSLDVVVDPSRFRDRDVSRIYGDSSLFDALKGKHVLKGSS